MRFGIIKYTPKDNGFVRKGLLAVTLTEIGKRNLFVAAVDFLANVVGIAKAFLVENFLANLTTAYCLPAARLGRV